MLKDALHVHCPHLSEHFLYCQADYRVTCWNMNINIYLIFQSFEKKANNTLKVVVDTVAYFVIRCG